ncbi:hypothetical protein ScPMuIL_013174 [Solemya velum]
MLAGAYSEQYKNVEKQHVEHLKELAQQDKLDVIARAKKLTIETNKRRRASAVRRKNEVQKEEKRRQNILAKRREKQREATEKYQRSHLPTRPSSNYDYRGATHGVAVLEQALRLVRGTSPTSHQASASSPKHHARYSSNRSFHKETAEALNRPYYNQHVSPPRPQSPAERVKEYSKTVAARNEMHNKSLRNLNNSRSLFEQQLEHHQQRMIEQQQQSMWEFNAAVMKEIQNDKFVQGVAEADDILSRSASLSSLDSLEESNRLQNSLNLTYQEESRKLIPPSKCSVFPQKSMHTEDLRGHVSQMAESFLPPNSPQSRNTMAPLPENIPHVNPISAKPPTHNSSFLVSEHSQVHSLPPKPPSAKNTTAAMPESLKNGTIFRSNKNERLVQSKSENAQVAIQNTPKQPGIDVSESTRPKIQRAWATPSPVSQGHSQALPASTNTLLTNTSPYSARNTMTTVTTITPFEKGHQTSQPNFNGNMEFLQTVTDDLPNINGEVKIARPDKAADHFDPLMNGTSIVNVRKEVLEEFSDKTSRENKGIASISQGTLGLVNGRLSVLPNKFPPKPPESTKITENFCERVMNQTEGLDLAGVNNDVSKVSFIEDKPESNHGGVRSILKQPNSTKKTGGILKKAGSTGSINKHFEVRDSLEVAKQHLQQQQDVKSQQAPKKTVRFADQCNWTTGEMEDSPENGEEHLFTKRNKESLTVNIKPTRPLSARPSLGSSKIESSTRAVKMASANHVNRPRQTSIQRPKSSVRPQAAAHIITQSSPENSTNHAQTEHTREKKVEIVHGTTKVQNGGQFIHHATALTIQSSPSVNYATTDTYSHVPHQNVMLPSHAQTYQPNVTIVPSSSSSVPNYATINNHQVQPVYNENGMRIDRTPTDDEINVLWDKVRTCLDQNTPSDHPEDKVDDGMELPRQAMMLSHKYIDGTALGPLNTMNRVTKPPPTSSNNLYVRKPGPGEQNSSYSRRYGLLQQRKQLQNPNELNKNVQVKKQNIMYQSPAISNSEPRRVVHQPTQEVSESLVTFMAAEQLSQQPVSDSHIQRELDNLHQGQELNTTVPIPKNAPTSLSIEERKLLESLDRLNEKLRITESKVPNSQKSTNPQYFVHAGGFKGHAPLMAHQQRPGTASMYTNTIRGYGHQY